MRGHATGLANRLISALVFVIAEVGGFVVASVKSSFSSADESELVEDESLSEESMSLLVTSENFLLREGVWMPGFLNFFQKLR